MSWVDQLQPPIPSSGQGIYTPFGSDTNNQVFQQPTLNVMEIYDAKYGSSWRKAIDKWYSYAMQYSGPRDSTTSSSRGILGEGCTRRTSCRRPQGQTTVTSPAVFLTLLFLRLTTRGRVEPFRWSSKTYLRQEDSIVITAGTTLQPQPHKFNSKPHPASSTTPLLLQVDSTTSGRRAFNYSLRWKFQ